MQIKKCRNCAQLIHADFSHSQRCWNCGTFVSFSARENWAQTVLRVLDTGLTAWLAPVFSGERWVKWNRRALLMALPLAVVMLLICNSFQISIVHDRTIPFQRLEIEFLNQSSSPDW